MTEDTQDQIDRFEEIIKARKRYGMPQSERMVDWLVAEVKRLRVIEDQARLWRTVDCDDLSTARRVTQHFVEILDANPRPGSTS